MIPWLNVYLMLFMTSSLQKIVMIWVVRRFIRYRLIYNLVVTLLIQLVMVSWLIWGNIIYFSEANQCPFIYETRPMASLMLFAIIIGYV